MFSLPGGPTRVGTKLFHPRINIVSHPWRPEPPKFTLLDHGVPAQAMYLVRNGTVETLRYSRDWAQQKNKRPSGPLGFALQPSCREWASRKMIKTTKRALPGLALL